MIFNEKIVKDEVRPMVAGISGETSFYNDIFSLYQKNSNNQSEKIECFEQLINNAQNPPEIISVDDIEHTDYSNENSPKKNSNILDLNKDGQITTEEIIKYTQLQQQENLEIGNMQKENNSNSKNFFQNFKTPLNQVLSAYAVFK